MTKRLNAKYKFDRRIGENLWGHQKSPARRRGTGIGQHASKTSFRRPSDYGTHLLAKQKLRNYYGNVTEKQFFGYFEEATRLKGNTTTNLIGLLERRLDIIVYRMRFAPTVFAARQVINHRHILVNGKIVTIASYQVKPNDVIAVSEKAKSFAAMLDSAGREDITVPDYISVDHAGMSGEFLRIPKLEDVPYGANMEPNLIIEFYSH